MMSEKELVAAVVEKTGMPFSEIEPAVHAMIDSAVNEPHVGEPVMNIEAGTVEFVVDRDALVRSMIEKTQLAVGEAQPIIETVLEVLVRV